MASAALPLSAQYYDIASQLPGLIQPALSGSFNYKGFAEVSFVKGVGTPNANFLDFSTTQGFQYSNWFFMGVGLGVDILFATQNNDDAWVPDQYWRPSSRSSTTGVMIPLYTDFRFTVPSGGVSFFADVRIGASFLLGNNYISFGGPAYLTNNESFYLRPSLGVRIPVNKQRPKQAVDIGVAYQLLTANYSNGWYNNSVLNAIGVNVAYEW